MLFSPEFPQRAAFAGPIFLIIASLTAINIIVKEKLLTNMLLKSFVALAGVAIVAFGAVSTIFSMSVDWKFLKQIRNRNHVVVRLHDKDVVELPKIKSVHEKEALLGKRTVLFYYVYLDSDLSGNPEDFRNKEYARYHGLKKVKTVE